MRVTTPVWVASEPKGFVLTYKGTLVDFHAVLLQEDSLPLVPVPVHALPRGMAVHGRKEGKEKGRERERKRKERRKERKTDLSFPSL